MNARLQILFDDSSTKVKNRFSGKHREVVGVLSMRSPVDLGNGESCISKIRIQVNKRLEEEARMLGDGIVSRGIRRALGFITNGGEKELKLAKAFVPEKVQGPYHTVDIRMDPAFYDTAKAIGCMGNIGVHAAVYFYASVKRGDVLPSTEDDPLSALRVCTCCGVEKELRYFYESKRSDGNTRRHKCAECTKAAQREKAREARAKLKEAMPE